MSKRDRFFLYLTGLSFLVSSVLFFRRESYNLQTRLTEHIGNLMSYENEVRHKQVASIDWQRVTDVNMDLLDGDQLFTEENSSAVVRLVNGVILNLKPNTLVKLELNGDNLNLNYLKGLMEIDFAGNDLEGKIALNGRSLGADGDGKLKIYQDGDKTLFNVQKGSVQLGDRSLSKGEELDSDGKRKLGDETIVLLGPEDDFRFSPIKRSSIKFKWRSPPGTKILTLEVARDPDFDNVILKRRSYGSSYSMGMPRDGRYYWRVRAPGLTSPISYFTVRNLPPARLLYPRVEEQLKVKLKQKLPIEFQWDGDPKQPYLLTVYTPNLGKKMKKKTFKVRGNSFETRLSDIGRYVWTVKPDHPKGLKSKSRSFRLRPNDFVKINYPKPEFVFDATRSNKPLTFELAKPPRGASALFVSNDVTFETIAAKKKFNTRRFNLKYAKPGEYYYKISSLLDPNFTTDVYEMTIINWTALNLSPRRDLKIRAKDKIQPMTFKWNPLYLGKYSLEVAKDYQFKDIVHQRFTKETKEKFNMEPGKYYWRLRATDPNLPDYWRQTEPRLLTIGIPQGPLRIKLFSPDIFAEEGIDVNGDEMYTYRVPAAEDSIQYFIEVIAEDGTKSTIKQATNAVKVLGSQQGVWKYRYKVKDKYGRETDYTKWGQIVFPVAPNYRPAPKKKPKTKAQNSTSASSQKS